MNAENQARRGQEVNRDRPAVLVSEANQVHRELPVHRARREQQDQWARKEKQAHRGRQDLLVIRKIEYWQHF